MTPYSNTNTLHLSALRAQSLPERMQDFINYKIKEIGDETITKAIKNEATAKNMPSRYINSIQSEFDGQEFWVWVDFKEKKGEPLDLFFEEGTKDHKIVPRIKKALAWAGEFFSKGHWVSGIKARHVFRDGFKKGYPEFKERLRVEIEQDTQESMMFG